MKKAAEFQKHSKSMADTASALAKSGGVTDRKLADALIRTAAKVGRRVGLKVKSWSHHCSLRIR